MIYGAGLSGLAMARLALHDGYDTDLWDDYKDLQDLPEDFLHAVQLSRSLFRFNQRGVDLSQSVFIPSPGIDEKCLWYRYAYARCISMCSEMEYSLQRLQSPYIAVTGTNGKTTVATQIAYLLKSFGVSCVVLGNAGTPVSEQVCQSKQQAFVYVVEFSSYQLSQISVLPAAVVSVITSLSCDHMERHGSWRRYLESKWKIITLGSPSMFITTNSVKQIALKDGFELSQNANCHIVDVRSGHEKSNSQLAALAVRAFASSMLKSQRENPHIHELSEYISLRDIDHASIDYLVQRVGMAPLLPHRLQPVIVTSDHMPVSISLIDDSKATNVQAVQYALEQISLLPTMQTALLLGGRVKRNNDYSKLVWPSWVVQGYVFGQDAQYILSQISQDDIKWNMSASLQELMRVGGKLHSDLWDRKIARVVLSPSGDSLDEFTSFSHRGQSFQLWAQILCDHRCIP